MTDKTSSDHLKNPITPLVYQAGGVTFKIATAADDEQLRATLRSNELDSWVNITFEREPNYFSGEQLMGLSGAVIAHEQRHPRAVVGMYNYTLLPVHINGIPQQAGYLGGLRVNPAYRHRLSIVKNGFQSLRYLMPHALNPPLWFTSLSAENTKARRLLEAGLKQLPRYQPHGELETLAISTQHGHFHGLLQAAEAADIHPLIEFFNQQAQRYQFSTVLTAEWLLNLNPDKGLVLNDFWIAKNQGQITACLAIWDQRAFKQTVARRYRFPLNQFLGPYNCLAKMTGRMTLPKPGQALEQVFIAFVAIQDHAGQFALEVIQEALALAKNKGAHVGVLGLASDNALCQKLKKTLKPNIYRSCIETVTWPDSPLTSIDQRPPQPEVALL